MNELYVSIGEFVVQFEHLIHSIRTTIMFLLTGNGLKSQNVANLILAGYTAGPLKSLFESLLGCHGRTVA